ncbi:hypothetical protein I312_101453 [Cryptococcus bacillisporus CA1280]|uniref:Unplaced genomic scaffold supercont1.11, whole genome shotgun sequence n=2 Tax=Cryptococcus gattii TaxID=552467 RepID=A0A0D0VJG9_CRYGA|nr:hypothetical protein I312_04066 [Cryptococcus bacillisporus CA1280]KIR59881.1 hypothetical protein I314_04316 [Cryptococcus bacillisporus CA1873]|eukprot:KIR59881.1 hypothetical protein I314_04316 [Cryptococcus gattii CA1873]
MPPYPSNNGAPSKHSHVRTELIKRPREACLNCRSLKTRCLPYGDRPLTSKDTCARCTKYGLECEYVRKPRGKPKTDDASNTRSEGSGLSKSANGPVEESRNQGGSNNNFTETLPNPLPSVLTPLKDDRLRNQNYMPFQPSYDNISDNHMASMPGMQKPEPWGSTTPNPAIPHGTSFTDSFARAIPPVLHPQSYQRPPTHSLSSYPTPPTAYASHMPPPDHRHTLQHYPQHPPSQLPPPLLLHSSSTQSDRSIHSMPSGNLPTPDVNDNSYRPHRQMTSPNQMVRLPPMDVGPPQSRLQAHSLPAVNSRNSQCSTPSYESSERRRQAAQPSSVLTDYIEPQLDHNHSHSPSPSIHDASRTGAKGPLVVQQPNPRGSVHSAHGADGAVQDMKAGGRLSSLSPLELGLVDEQEARWLYSRFKQHLGPIIALLDFEYHTYERVKLSDSLFTAMLYASSRFFHPEICRPLYNHANTIVSRMITHGTVDLPSVQALIMLAFWSVQNDESAYMKSGIAVRAACQLRLWKKHDRPLPQDEEEVRAILDRERTWIAVIIMDAGFGVIFEQPMTLPQPNRGFDDIYEWASEHAHLNIPGDYYLAWSAEDSKNRSPSYNNVQNPSYENTVVVTERRYIDNLNKALPHLSPLYSQMATIITDIVLARAQSEGLKFGHIDMIKNRLISLSERITESLNRFAAEGHLLFWSDMFSAGVSMPGVLFYKTRSLFSPTELDRILAILNSLLNMCSTMLGAHNDHPLYFTYRFYRRLLPVLERVRQGVESQQPPVVEVEYPYPVALLSELHTSQNGNNSHASHQLATPSNNTAEVDELWNFILGEDSGMGQIFTA